MSGYNAVLARNTDKAPQGTGPYSQTVAFSHYNNLSAQLPIDPASGKLVAGGVKEQAEQCYRNLKAVVESIGHKLDDSVRISIFLTNIADAEAVGKVHASFFPDYVPTLTTVGVAALPLGAQVQVEALITCGEGTIPNAPQAGDLIKVEGSTENAPLNPLSTQSVAFSHYNNLSAQLPIDPRTGKLVSGGIKEQTAQCLRNIKNILEGIDVPFDDIVRITVFVKNLADAEAVNQVYTTFFPDSAIARAVGYFPARTVVAAKALPLDALVQIEAVVSHGDGPPAASGGRPPRHRHQGPQHRRRAALPLLHPDCRLLPLQPHLRPAAAGRPDRRTGGRRREGTGRPVLQAPQGHRRKHRSRPGGCGEGQPLPDQHRRYRRSG